MPDVAVDNDILIKLAAYRLLKEGLAALDSSSPIGVLGAARFVVPSTIARSGSRISDKEGATSAWSAVLGSTEALEPDQEELALAARFEQQAALQGLSLDPGESQLFAMAIARGFDSIATGDKRAINATEQLRESVPPISQLDGRVICLEQVVDRLMDLLDEEHVRGAICREPAADRALCISMSCFSDAPYSREGLQSYIADLRSSAPSLLGCL